MFKKAVITRHSWQLKKKKSFFTWDVIQRLIEEEKATEAVCRRSIYHLKAAPRSRYISIGHQNERWECQSSSWSPHGTDCELYRAQALPYSPPGFALMFQIKDAENLSVLQLDTNCSCPGTQLGPSHILIPLANTFISGIEGLQIPAAHQLRDFVTFCVNLNDGSRYRLSQGDYKAFDKPLLRVLEVFVKQEY